MSRRGATKTFSRCPPTRNWPSAISLTARQGRDARCSSCIQSPSAWKHLHPVFSASSWLLRSTLSDSLTPTLSPLPSFRNDINRANTAMSRAIVVVGHPGFPLLDAAGPHNCVRDRGAEPLQEGPFDTIIVSAATLSADACAAQPGQAASAAAVACDRAPAPGSSHPRTARRRGVRSPRERERFDRIA
jgi:hypothetical protein